MAQTEECDPMMNLPNGTQISIIHRKDDDEESYLDDYMEVIAIKCKLCDFIGGSRFILRSHLKESHVRSIPPQDKMLIDGLLSLGVPQTLGEEESSVYLCAHCSKPFPDKMQCKVHMQKEHKFVKKTFFESDDLKKCPRSNCSYTFSKRDLETHLLCHLQEEDPSEEENSSFQCFKCNEPFDKWGNVAIHLWKSHEIDVGLLGCSVCSYKTFYIKNLEIHSQTHSDDKPFLCSKCEKSFKQLAQLKNHMVTHLDKETDVVPSWYAKKKCDLCDKLFSDSKCLKKHVQAVHSKLKPYICQVCNHSTSRKAMLKMHMRQHTGEKPYKCDVCPYKTGDHNSLRRHKYRHTGMSQHRNYRSGYCPPNSHRVRRQGGGGFGGGHYNGHQRNCNPGRYRHELPPLIPIPQHRRTCSTNSSLSSCSSSSGGSYSSSTLSSRFSSYDEQQKYIDSFEATMASDNPFNQINNNPFEDDNYIESIAPIPPPFYHYPPPPSKMLRLIQQIRKYDVEKLKTLKTISLDALYDNEGDDKCNEDRWLSQMTVDVFRYQSQPGEDYFLEEPFSVASSSSSSSSSTDEDVDNFEFTHHIHSLLDLISS